VDLATLQGLLEPEEAVFEYVIDDPKSHCLVVTNTSVKHYELVGVSAVRKAIAEYLNDTNAMRDSQAARLLYRQLFAPIAEFGQKSQIIIVPDGQLGFIPFDGLINEDGKYVLQGHTISYVPSATVLALLRSNRQPRGLATLLAIGSSNDTNASSRSFGRAAHGLFDPDHPEAIRGLPSVNSEVQEVTEIFGGGSQPLVGPNASESGFKSHNLQQYQVIHIAAHGFADVKFPDRSGLFLGFDQGKHDDGLLQIREIRDLRLRADLVTLSACDAGAGKLEGQNGIASVVQAFLFAGARSVVASLWTVDDTFTAALMARFYRELAAGKPVGTALRSAKLEMIDRFGAKAVPLLWAGFFATGDPATRIVLSKSNDKYQTTN
jgi:CHAT domain-containing protein